MNGSLTVAETMAKHIPYHGKHQDTQSEQLHSEEPRSVFRMATTYKTCSTSVGIFLDFVTRTVWHSAFNSDSWPPETWNYIRYLS